jgi:hypothetical protein
MWQQFWHDAVRNLGPVYIGLAIVFVITTVIRKRLEVQRKARVTYVLADGGLNAVSVTLDAQLNEAERRRILLAHGAVLSTYAPAFDPNSAASAQPVRLAR